MRRVAVTGMGVVSPLGVGIDAFWDGLTHGRSGVRRITRFDPSPYPSQIAGEIPDFDAAAHLPRRDIVRTDVFIHYALISAQAALADSGVKIDGQNDRVGRVDRDRHGRGPPPAHVVGHAPARGHDGRQRVRAAG